MGCPYHGLEARATVQVRREKVGDIILEQEDA